MKRKIVFLKIVDGAPQDNERVMRALLSVSQNTEFNFIVAPPGTEVKSISLEDLKKLITDIEEQNGEVKNYL